MADEPKTLSLTERLALATQTKNPGEVKTPTLQVEEPKTTETKPKQNANFDDWNTDQDFEQAKTSTTGPTAANQSGTTPATTDGKRPPSLKEMKAGARSVTAAVDMAQRMLFTNLSKKKALGQFTPDQLKLINEIDILPKALLKDEAINLLSKYQKAVKKHEKISKEIPFNEQEKQDWELMLMLYQEESGKALPQWLYAALTAVTSLGKRGFDIYFD